MKLVNTDVVVVGAGPAGLSAALEAAKSGARVILIDEHDTPGGQLFKQIHKFFGSKEHKAGVRGIHIAKDLVEQVKQAGVNVLVDSAVWGVFPGFSVGVTIRDEYSIEIRAPKIIVCTGAAENTILLEGSTLPGVIGAGAAQTLANIHMVRPGKRALMVGSGNVGLIVTYQLLQAGVDVVAVVEMLPDIGGYMVHASKIRRAGVPIYTSSTILKVEGNETVERAVIAQLDENRKPIESSIETLDVDLVCLAVGLRPMSDICWMMGCEARNIGNLGGFVPVHDEFMESTVRGLYVAGDISGIEEASVAMEEGRLAGISASQSLGFLTKGEGDALRRVCYDRLRDLRSGSHGQAFAMAKAELCGKEL